MTVGFSKRFLSRALTGVMLVSVAGVLSGCGGSAVNSFDPTDMLSFLDTKKPLPGARKPVFPEGVPGVEQGVPKELYKGAQQNDLAATNPGASPVTGPQGAAPAPAAEAPPVEEKPKKKVRTAKRRSITAPPPDEAPAAAPPQQQPPAAAPARERPLSPFPAPLPSGSFSH